MPYTRDGRPLAMPTRPPCGRAHGSAPAPARPGRGPAAAAGRCRRRRRWPPPGCLTTVSSAVRVTVANRLEISSIAGPATLPPRRLTMAVVRPIEAAYPLPLGPSTQGVFGYGSGMAQRARRRNSEPRKAPDWVPDELLDRLGVLLRDETFPKQARKVGRYWTGAPRRAARPRRRLRAARRAARADRRARGALRAAARRAHHAAGRHPVAARVGRDRPVRGQQRSGAGPGRGRCRRRRRPAGRSPPARRRC